jgi:hypothetical protein
VDKKTNNKIMTGMEAGKQATEQQKKEQVIHARTTGERERESYRTYWSVLGQSLATLTPTLISSKMTYLSIEYIHTRKIVVLNEYNRVDMFNADKVSSSRRK